MRAAIPVVLLLLAAWFLHAPEGPGLPSQPTPAFDHARLVPSTPRTPMADPRIMEVAGLDMRCNDCHDIFPSAEQPVAPLRQHTDIVLDHGMNDRCLNCHARADRERYELRGDVLIGLDESPRLCASCHGPTFRDWERGIHGRTDGYWSAAHGQPRRLTCIECHDPHSPAYPGLQPLPGPHAWRAPSEAAPAADAGPLDFWLQRTQAAVPPEAHDG